MRVLIIITSVILSGCVKPESLPELRTLQADSFEGEPVCESVDSLEFNLNQ